MKSLSNWPWLKLVEVCEKPEVIMENVVRLERQIEEKIKNIQELLK